MFSQACVKNSVHYEGGVHPPSPGRHTPGRRPLPPPPPPIRWATAADGTHAIGMHSCLKYYIDQLNGFLHPPYPRQVSIESDNNWNTGWNGISLWKCLHCLIYCACLNLCALFSESVRCTVTRSIQWALRRRDTSWPPPPPTRGRFKAFKLGEIIVKVRYSCGLPNKVLLYFGNRWASVVTVNTVLWMCNFWKINGWMFG